MPVTSIGPYHFLPRDRAEIYGDNRIVYFCWDRHLLFAAPFLIFAPKSMRFADFIEERVKPLIAPDPDSAAIDWSSVRWMLGTQAFEPAMAATLEENGVGHKFKIIMQTPGLNSLTDEN